MGFTSSAQLIRAARIAGWAVMAASTLLLLQSAFWSETVPWVAKIALPALVVSAALRPAHALVFVAAAVPFGHLLATRVWRAHPFSFSEALVLAFFAGYLWRARKQLTDSDRPATTLGVIAWPFALVVAASGFVEVALLQIWHDYPGAYAVTFGRFLATEYLTASTDPRPWVDGRDFFSTGALLLEGFALLLCTRTLCLKHPRLEYKLTNAVVAAGVVSAALSLQTFATFASETGQTFGALTESARWAPPTIPSLSTSAGHFLLVAFIAFGSMALSRVYLVMGLLAGLLCLAAMWLTGTRSALVGGPTALLCGAGWWLCRRWKIPTLRLVIGAVTALLAVATVSAFYNPLQLLSSGAARSLRFRFLFTEAALRMFASEPLFGVGIGRYTISSTAFSSPELLDWYSKSETHNNFLWVGTELGLVGLIPFLWFIAASFAPVRSALRAPRVDYWLLGLVTGLIAFFVTWLAWQPLSVPQTAYTFWIMLGIVAGYSSHSSAPAETRPRRAALATMALAAVVILVVASIPIRLQRAIAEIDFSRVKYGFYNPGIDNGREFIWAGPDVRFYRRATDKAIIVPLASKLPSTRAGVDIDVRVDGALVDRLTLRDHEWHELRLDAPATVGRFWRIDLYIAPIDMPGDVGSAYRRVAVAPITVAPGRAAIERR